MVASGRVRSRLPLPAVPRLVIGGAVALVAGAVCGLVLEAAGVAESTVLVDSDAYLFGAGLLLGVGLYGSTYGIELKALRADLRGVVAAVTLGVVLKAALITGTMMLVFHRPEALILGIAVAQIDPLSVAALGQNERMSARARSLLTAWASFDDPMTVLLTLYLAGIAYSAKGGTGMPEAAGGSTGGYLAGLGLNAVLLAGVLLLWFTGRRAGSRVSSPVWSRRAGAVGSVVLVATMLVLAAAEQLMLAVALAGLVVRSGILGKVLDRAVGFAYLTAFLALGLLLAHGVAWWPGLVLGVAAFAAQAVVALLVMPLFVKGLSRTDRIELGLGQQNGITAVLIALTLERDFPGTSATVGPAVITVNVLYSVSQALRARPPRPPRRPDGELHGVTGRHSQYGRQSADDRRAVGGQQAAGEGQVTEGRQITEGSPGAGRAPSGEAPGGTVAGGEAPGGEAPAGTVAGGRVAGSTTAGSTRADGTAAGGTTAGGTAAGSTTADSTAAGGTTADRTAAGGTTADSTAAGGAVVDGRSVVPRPVT